MEEILKLVGDARVYTVATVGEVPGTALPGLTVEGIGHVRLPLSDTCRRTPEDQGYIGSPRPCPYDCVR
jgi:hypothetical protein